MATETDSVNSCASDHGRVFSSGNTPSRTLSSDLISRMGTGSALNLNHEKKLYHTRVWADCQRPLPDAAVTDIVT